MEKNTNKKAKGLPIGARRAIAYAVLILVSLLCLIWFYILFINATRSKGELTRGFTPIPSTHLIENLKNGVFHGSAVCQRHAEFPVCRWMQCSALHLLLDYDRLCDPCV